MMVSRKMIVAAAGTVAATCNFGVGAGPKEVLAIALKPIGGVGGRNSTGIVPGPIKEVYREWVTKPMERRKKYLLDQEAQGQKIQNETEQRQYMKDVRKFEQSLVPEIEKIRKAEEEYKTAVGNDEVGVYIVFNYKGAIVREGESTESKRLIDEIRRKGGLKPEPGVLQMYTYVLVEKISDNGNRVKISHPWNGWTSIRSSSGNELLKKAEDKVLARYKGEKELYDRMVERTGELETAKVAEEETIRDALAEEEKERVAVPKDFEEELKKVAKQEREERAAAEKRCNERELAAQAEAAAEKAAAEKAAAEEAAAEKAAAEKAAAEEAAAEKAAAKEAERARDQRMFRERIREMDEAEAKKAAAKKAERDRAQERFDEIMAKLHKMDLESNSQGSGSGRLTPRSSSSSSDDTRPTTNRSNSSSISPGTPQKTAAAVPVVGQRRAAVPAVGPVSTRARAAASTAAPRSIANPAARAQRYGAQQRTGSTGVRATTDDARTKGKSAPIPRRFAPAALRDRAAAPGRPATDGHRLYKSRGERRRTAYDS